MSQNRILSPSILSADFCRLGEQIKVLEEAGAKYLHIDVMDGIFVPCISFGMTVIKSIRKSCDMVFDVHLMIHDPGRYVEEFAQCGADLINFHLEATEDAADVIRKIKACGKKAGITIKPGTPAAAVEPYLDMVDMVLVMTVEPGFGGQKLMPECLNKISDIREMIDKRGLDIDIEVDGGVTLGNISEVLQSGANIIVAGSSVFRDSLEKNVRAFCEAF